MDENDDNYSLTAHIAHDIRTGRFPQQSSKETFLAERAAAPLVARGVSRDVADNRTLLVFFDRAPTDDELREVHRKLSLSPTGGQHG